MAFSRKNYPAVRMSDIDDLVREHALDSSDGLKLIEYIKQKQGPTRTRINQLFDGADKPINFRLDHLQPVPARQSNQPSDTSHTDAVDSRINEKERAAAAASGIALVQPLSPVEDENRMASFVTPTKDNLKPSRGTRIFNLENTATPSVAKSPPGQRLASPSRIPIQHVRVGASLNRQTLIKECQRANSLKFEILRQLASSTPNLNDKRDRSNDNFMNFKETISPICDDRTPDGATLTATVANAAQVRLNVGTVPATQDQPDVVERNIRECTPPPEDRLMVIPETPSPVRRAPHQSGSPFSALSSHSMRISAHRMRLSAEQAKMTGTACDNVAVSNDSVCSSTQKSILKKRQTNLGVENMNISTTPRNRVSFADRLCDVHQVSPAYVRSPQPSDVTSDESSNEEAEEVVPERVERDRTVRTVKPFYTEEAIPAHSVGSSAAHINRASRLMRSNAIDLQSEPVDGNQPNNLAQSDTCVAPQRSPHSFKRRSIALDNSGQNDVARKKQQANCSSSRSASRKEGSPSDMCERNNIREGLESSSDDEPLAIPPRAKQCSKDARLNAKDKTNSDVVNMLTQDWGGSSSSGENDDDRNRTRHTTRSQHRTITSPMEIMNIDTPHTVMMDIVDPPSPFCDIETVDVQLEAMTVVEPQPEDPAAQRKQQESGKRGAVDPAPVEPVETANRNTILSKTVNKTRIVSITSPMDQVSSKMIDVVDTIHMQGSLVGAMEDIDARRTTIVLPTKKRRGRPRNVDCDTEKYFKNVAKPTKSVTERKKGHERRRLFVRDIAEMTNPYELGENIPSPEPLALTPQEEDASDEIITQPLAIVLKRMSNGTIDRLVKGDQEAVVESEASKSPIEAISVPQKKHRAKEKQNTEATEKPPVTFDKAGADGGNAAETLECPEINTHLSKSTEARYNGKKAKKKSKTKPHQLDESRGSKYWKDVSNEFRQQVENEGLRRSNRTKCISKEVLRRNPVLSRNDAPRYIMPTVSEIMEYYKQSELVSKTSKPNSRTTTKKGMVRTEQEYNSGPIGGESSQQKTLDSGKEKRKKRNVACEARIDDDGFCIPAVPVANGSSQTSGKKRPDNDGSKESSTMVCDAESHDSGHSSGVMTNDEVTEPHPTRGPEQQQPCSSSSMPAGGSATSQPQEAASADIISERRQAMNWMLMLMENQQERPEALMTVELQGFTHCSVEHLAFQRRGDIEYSFYIYSKRDNFGFVRLLPNAKKKMTRLTNFHLKFLILNGSLAIIINDHEVKAVGGDFLMLPAGSTYQIRNESQMSLMFMIKTTIDSTK